MLSRFWLLRGGGGRGGGGEYFFQILLRTCFYKYDTVLWTMEKLKKTRELKFSGNMYFSYPDRLASAKIEKVLSVQINDEKVTLLLIYHISGF